MNLLVMFLCLEKRYLLVMFLWFGCTPVMNDLARGGWSNTAISSWSLGAGLGGKVRGPAGKIVTILRESEQAWAKKKYTNFSKTFQKLVSFFSEKKPFFRKKSD